MKKLLHVLWCIPFLSLSQENLVPNGGVEAHHNDYSQPSDPLDFYSGVGCNTGRQRFEDDILNWHVAKPTPLFLQRCSPDLIPPDIVLGDGFCPANDDFYVRSTLKNESIVVELKDGYKLKKGQSYKFQIKYRQARAWAERTGSFQVVFSTKPEGLRVNVNKKWVALDIYDVQSCNWKNYEAYFTVPSDDDNKYEDMRYLVLQYNHEVNKSLDESTTGGSASLIWHWDDVFLSEGEKCEDIKYIQDKQYHETHKIEQANQEIRAGAYVSPYSWPANEPVVVGSTAKVIYRAPSVYLEPGFFIEEEGSYFETQVGTCVDDPCPQLPGFTPPDVVNCSVPFSLGWDLANTPGVFYVWEPEEYFSAPWSKVTEFSPPDESGCVNAKLTAWSICGAVQETPFTVKYFDGPPTIDLSNIQQSITGINFEMDLTNANTYTIYVFDPATGTVHYEDFNDVNCSLTGQSIDIAIDHCTVDLCQDLRVKVVAHNDCYGQVNESFAWQAPIINDPNISVNNLISTDFDFQFDLDVPQEYEYFTIETWDESMTELVCSQSYSRCGNPFNGSMLHYDIRDCLANCLAQCKNYKVKISMKLFCNSTVKTEVLEWSKTNTSFSMPSSYPNVITLNGDGVNETLCFEPVAADFYHLVVVDSWGGQNTNPQGVLTQIQFASGHQRLV